MLKEELHSCKKRLQRLETDRKHGNAPEKTARGRSRSVFLELPSRKNVNSFGKGKARDSSNSKSVRFEGASENSSAVSKSNNSIRSNKSKKKGQLPGSNFEEPYRLRRRRI